MRNIWLFYSLIFVPFIALIFAFKMNLLANQWSVGLLFFYALIYRTWTDGTRLKEKGLIKNWWTAIIPITRYKYFDELYLK